MGLSMFDMSKRIVQDSIKFKNPTIEEADLKAQTFLRFYKDDFDAVELAKIIKHLHEI